MKLKQGIRAIDFTLTDIKGQEVKLSDYKGRKIYLTFMRNVSCPFCNVRVHRLMGNRLRLERSGLKVILLFESSGEKLQKSILHQGLLPWNLIGDPEKNLYKTYGVEKSVFKMLRTYISANNVKETITLSKTLETTKEKDKDASDTLIPADFFINEDFIIERAHYGKHLDNHLPIEDIWKFAVI